MTKSRKRVEDVMSDQINARPGQALDGIGQDGLDRHGLLKCMAWAGVGIVWAVSGGVRRSMGLADAYAGTQTASLSFVQISDSHIGFNKPAIPHPGETLTEAIGICGILAVVAARADIGPLAIGAARAGEAREVQIDNYSFSPGVLTVRAGAMVTRVNHDELPHTIVSADSPRQFISGGLDIDDKFSFTFGKAGAYTYICSVHPHMIGKIIVQ